MAHVESADESVQGLVHPRSAESEWSRFRQGGDPGPCAQETDLLQEAMQRIQGIKSRGYWK